MKLIDNAVSTVKDVAREWKTPRRGNFVSYKEILCLGVGGMGQQCVTTLMGVLALSSGNMLLGATLGIRPVHLQTMAVIKTALDFVFYLLRGWIVDNTRTKWGRFRPYIAIMGFPLVILATVFVWLPFEGMSYNEKLTVTFCFAIATAMVQPFFTDTYTEMQTVITPNSEERTKVIAINALLYSFAPTVTGFLIPFLSQFTGGLNDITIYRTVYVAIAMLGVGLNLFTAFGCKERIVTSTTYKQKVNVFKGCLQIYRNKYWWLRLIAGWIGFLEGASGVIFMWLYVYGTQDMTNYALLTTILGTASGIGMAATPFILKRLGNRSVLLLHNGLNIVFIGLMTFFFKIPIILFILIYLNSFIGSWSNVYGQSMHSEVKDYQQYLSGKRMDFLFGAAGLIGTPITMATGYVIPYVYEYMGLTTNYNILYDPVVRNSLFFVLCVLSVIGATLNLIPFFFYDLSREKHKNIVNVLRYRALFEDFETDYFDPYKIRDGVDGFRAAFEFASAPAPDMKALKEQLKAAKAMPKGDDRTKAVSEAKAQIRAAKKFPVEKKASQIFIDEFEKFKKPENAHAFELAQELASYDKDNLTSIDTDSIMSRALAMPKDTRKERKIRKADIKRAKKIADMVDMIKKNYSGNITEPNPSRLQNALDMPENTKAQSKEKKAAIKAAETELSMYHETLGFWLEADETVRRKISYENLYERAEEKYQWACEEIERIESAPKKSTANAK